MSTLFAVIFFLLGCTAISFAAGMVIVGSMVGWEIDGNLAVTGKAFLQIGGPVIGTFGLLLLGSALVVLKSQRGQETLSRPSEPVATSRSEQIAYKRFRRLLDLLARYDAVRAASREQLDWLTEDDQGRQVPNHRMKDLDIAWELGHVLVEETRHLGQVPFIRGIIRDGGE